MITARVETEDLARALVRYQAITGKTMAEVVRKQGRKLGFALYKGLREISPERGEIRRERLAALDQGEGLIIHKAARRSGFTDQKRLVRKELTERERARGFLSFSTIRREVERTLTQRTRSGAPASKGEFHGGGHRDSALVLSWGRDVSEVSRSAAEGLGEKDASRRIAAAMTFVRNDIEQYSSRKLRESFRMRKATA